MHVGLLSIPGTTAMIALALGYIVVVLANKEKGRLKSYGYMIGVAIIIVSSLLILVKFLLITTYDSNRYGILMRQKMMMQEREPLKMMPPAPVPKK